MKAKTCYVCRDLDNGLEFSDFFDGVVDVNLDSGHLTLMGGPGVGVIARYAPGGWLRIVRPGWVETTVENAQQPRPSE